MRVLFTGHKGFLGRELIPKLSTYIDVITYPDELEDVRGLKSFVKSKEVDAVIHAAARGGRRTSIDNERILVANLASSLNVAHLDLPTLSFCSGAIYGRQSSIFLAKEESSGNRYPDDIYGQSKFLFHETIKNSGNVTFLRYFNVFGLSEGFDRFISFNISRYMEKSPQVVYKDFFMDFFYVHDSIPIILDWLNLRLVPNEVNLVYPEKLKLTQVCNIINTLNDYSSPITILDHGDGKDYCGDGSLLRSLNYKLVGLREGIKQVYSDLKKLN